jgi:hypothetical protein
MSWIRQNWQAAALALIGLVIGGALGIAVAGGDDGDSTVTDTKTVVSTQTKTRTVRRGGRTGSSRAKTVVRTQTQTVATDPDRPSKGVKKEESGGTRTFTGSGTKNLGLMRVPRKSTITWKNSGQVFSVISETQIHVSSRKKTGRETLPRGTYRKFRVAALGKWTMKIIPR